MRVGCGAISPRCGDWRPPLARYADQVERPKAHHYIPAAHLSRFSPDPESIPARDRTLAVYSKRDGGFRRAKAGKLAFENDLYTFRT